MKHVKLYIFKKRAGSFRVKHRKKIRTAKAVVFTGLFALLKYKYGLDVDVIYLVLAIWWLREIK